jgi:acyl-CoA dehydrogenase
MTMQPESRASETAAPELMSEMEMEMVRDTARSFSREECKPSVVRAAEAGDWSAVRATWPRLAELGWLTLLAEGENESVGLTAACIIAEELGRAAYPLPFAELATVIVPLLSRYGSPAQRQQFLEPLAAGKISAALAMPLSGLPGSAQDCMSVPVVQQGQALAWMANHLYDADLLFVPVRLHGAAHLAIFVRPPEGWKAPPMQDIANSSWSLVTTADLAPERMTLIGDGAMTWEALRDVYESLRLVTAASVVGLAAEALDLTIAYAKERIAFGRPIGSFQAVQQRIAESALEVSAARLLMLEASIDCEPGHVAIACVQAAEAGKKATFTAQQIWGGMGYTLEVDVQLFFWRARAAQLLLGHPWQLHRKIWETVVPH